jgi:hypothetical protein
MSKIWKVATRICFDTIYYVTAEKQPSADQVIELAKDGYIPEFSQGPSNSESAIYPPEEVSEEEFLAGWHAVSDGISKEEKLGFLVNLDVKPPENLSDVGKEEII